MSRLLRRVFALDGKDLKLADPHTYRILRNRSDMVIKLECPKCGFVIEMFAEEDLNDPRKKKRHEALLKRPSLCVNCKTMVSKLKEVKG